jgi:hypothetical protein
MKDLENFIIRMEEVLTLRNQHDELLKLLTEEEQKKFNVGKAFEPFS